MTSVLAALIVSAALSLLLAGLAAGMGRELRTVRRSFAAQLEQERAGGSTARRELADAERRHSRGMTARDGLLVERLRDRFILTLQSGETFDGLLEDVDERTVVVRNASALQPGGQAVPVDGELLLRRDSISYLQRP